MESKRMNLVMAAITIAMMAVLAAAAWAMFDFAPPGIRIAIAVISAITMAVPLVVYRALYGDEEEEAPMMRVQGPPHHSGRWCPECHLDLRATGIPFCLGCGRADAAA